MRVKLTEKSVSHMLHPAYKYYKYDIPIKLSSNDYKVLFDEREPDTLLIPSCLLLHQKLSLAEMLPAILS